MVDNSWCAHGLIRVETPTILLVFLNYLCNLLMMPKLDTLPFLQLYYHLLRLVVAHMWKRTEFNSVRAILRFVSVNHES
jgi:hypothetical protein